MMRRTSIGIRGPNGLCWAVLLAASGLACSSDPKEDDETSFADGNTGTDDEVSGDGDTTTGDGDTTTGDGDGDTADTETDTTTGDGDGDTADTETDTTTGDGDTTTGDGDGDTSDDGPIPCDVAEAELTPVVPHLMLVLDKSGSMIQNTWDHDNDPGTAEITRWKSLHAVVSQVVNGNDELFDIGAQLFPSKTATNEYNQNACLVDTPPEVLVAVNNAVAILLGIPTANSQNIRGGTPASAGMISAIDHLIDIDDNDPAAIILITDGAANCRMDAANNTQRFESYDVNLPIIVGDAYNDLGIATYVVGIDISNQMTQTTGVNNHPPDGEPDGIIPAEKVNEVAVAGGKPKGGDEDFYQANNELELQAALQAIIDDAVSCTVLLDPVPAFPNLLEVVMDDQNVPKVADCETEDGWTYTNPNGPYDSLELCGVWCGESVNAEFVKAEYFCDPG